MDGCGPFCGFVLIFGEIIPQAVCTGSPLRIGAMLAPVIHTSMFLFWPVAYPLSLVLDCVLGKHTTHFLSGRAQLRSLFSVTQAEHVLDADEARILKAVMSLKSTVVRDRQTPTSDIYMVSEADVLDQRKLEEVLSRGHSRIPVFRGNRNNIKSILLAKSLIVVDPSNRTKVSQMPTMFKRAPLWVSPDTQLLPLLHAFLQNRLHLALVTEQLQAVRLLCVRLAFFRPFVRVSFLVFQSCQCVLGATSVELQLGRAGGSVEDIIEALIDEPIEDEFDGPESLTTDDTTSSMGPGSAAAKSKPKLGLGCLWSSVDCCCSGTAPSLAKLHAVSGNSLLRYVVAHGFCFGVSVDSKDETATDDSLAGSVVFPTRHASKFSSMMSDKDEQPQWDKPTVLDISEGLSSYMLLPSPSMRLQTWLLSVWACVRCVPLR